MIKAIRMFFAMKMNEWKVKAKVYAEIALFLDNYDDIVDTLKKLFESLKDSSADEIKETFVSKLAEIIHEENKE